MTATQPARIFISYSTKDGAAFADIPAGDDAIVTLDAVTLDRPGVHRFTVRSRDGAITGTVNPVLVVEAPEVRPFWGDTHGHSGFAEGIGTPRRFMTYARDDARLRGLILTHADVDPRRPVGSGS